MCLLIGTGTVANRAILVVFDDSPASMACVVVRFWADADCGNLTSRVMKQKYTASEGSFCARPMVSAGRGRLGLGMMDGEVARA